MKTRFWAIALVCLAGCSSGEGADECAVTNPQITPSCNDCLRGSCCGEASACADGTACHTCVSTASCSDKGQADLDAFNECLSNRCSNPCGFGDTAGTGGTAGSDATSGTGGTDAGGTAGVTMTAGAPPEGNAGEPTTTPECTDADAPGKLPADALHLDATSDCNDTPLKHAGEVLAPTDTDWFSYSVADEALCAINGNAAVTGGQLQLCAFGNLKNCDITCTTGTATTRGALKGCCASGSDPSLKWGTTCGLGESASGTMLLEVTSATDACQPYGLSYGF